MTHQHAADQYADDLSTLFAALEKPQNIEQLSEILRLEHDELEKLLATHDFAAFTAKSISEAETLCRELKDVRKTGYAYDRCEFDPDVVCVATTVQDFAGRPVAALGISGPVWRMTPKLIRSKQKALLGIASELSEKLGRPAE